MVNENCGAETLVAKALRAVLPDVPCLACEGKRADCPCCSTWTTRHHVVRFFAVCLGGWMAVQAVDIHRHNANLKNLRA